MQRPELRVVFLVGEDSGSTRASIEAVCKLENVRPVAVLLDTDAPGFRRKVRNLRRSVRKHGVGYLYLRFIEALDSITASAARRAAVPRDEVRALLRTAFPDRCSSLSELGARYGFAVHEAGNLNGPEAVRILTAQSADLGIVLGTRVLKPPTFSAPRLGSINLHKGRVPEYRGMPPGFWELYDGAATAGVTVHFVDKGLDTGDVIATGEVRIEATETPDTLLEKLHQEGSAVLAQAVAALRDGTAVRRKQASLSVKPRTTPSEADVRAVQVKLPHWKRPGGLGAVGRNLFLLAVYYSGIYHAVRAARRLSGSRAAILLYHRVNDYSRDVLTVDVETFAEQILAIRSRYPVATSAELVRRIRERIPVTPTTVAVHFDDCYRDVVTHGRPVLAAAGVPACAMVNSGFVGTDRRFAHDAAKYPFRFENMSADDVRLWVRDGFELGAHTVNHVDLGKCVGAEAREEITVCGESLRDISGAPVDLFSFPFGGRINITEENRKAVRDAGYSALFSAHGGFIGPSTNAYSIPRMGSSYEHSALYCLLQIEGLTLAQLAERFR